MAKPMVSESDLMDPRTGRINGRAPGQPYERQWWMKYWSVEVSPPSPEEVARLGARARGQVVRFKKNIFTRTTYVFRFNVKPEGNRWNEPGFGWGVWEKV